MKGKDSYVYISLAIARGIAFQNLKERSLADRYARWILAFICKRLYDAARSNA